MPVLEGLWGQDLRMRNSGLGVDVGVCANEAPPSPIWGPLRMPPVTCGGGLSLALELPALIRQLRAAWKARRGGPMGPERSQASTWEEAEKEEAEEVMLEPGDGSSRLKGNMSSVSRTAGPHQCFITKVCLSLSLRPSWDSLNSSGTSSGCTSPSCNGLRVTDYL